jgi:hypothetical protein
MIKRIEFTLNLDDPYEAAIYQALRPSLKYRRAGALIRAALDAHLVKPENDPRQPYGQRQLGGGQ